MGVASNSRWVFSVLPRSTDGDPVWSMPTPGCFQNNHTALQRYESIWDTRFWMKMMNMTNLLAFGKDEQIDFLILLVVESSFSKKLSIGEVVTGTVAIPLPDM